MKSLNSLVLRLSLVFVACSFASPAQACTLCSCSASATNMTFGTYDPLSGTAKTANATVTVDCSSLLPLLGSVDISLSPGLSGIATARTLKKGTDALSYNVYRDAALSSIVGNGSSGTSVVTKTLSALLFYSSTTALYGKIPARQWVAPGNYSDSLVVTLTF